MARRKEAGPRIPVITEVKRPKLTNTHRDWLTEALDIEADLAPFEDAITTLVISLAAEATGPRARAVAAEVDDFIGNHVRATAAAFVKLSRAAGEAVFEQHADFVHALLDVMRSDLAKQTEDAPDMRATIVDVFIMKIIRAARAAGAHAALPSRSNRDEARQFPIFQTIRSAIEIAVALAPAMPELAGLAKMADATLVDRIHRATRNLVAALA
jgi:hypothetical protein